MPRRIPRLRSITVSALAAWLFAACASSAPLRGDAPAASSVGSVTGCAPGFELLASGSCLLVPEGVEGPPLMLFLHGMYDPQYPDQELALEEKLGAAARARGIAVLVPRGEPGLCNWAPQFATWRCWPSRGQQRPDVGRIVIGLGSSFREASSRLRLRLMRPVIVGFSNGGFFASMIAADTKLDVAGYAIINAGPAEPISFPAQRAAPVLLIAAEDDAMQRPKMERLRVLLTEAQWSPRYVTRAGGHSLTAEDLRLVLDFVSEAGR